jgi:hypothetical protein
MVPKFGFAKKFWIWCSKELFRGFDLSTVLKSSVLWIGFVMQYLEIFSPSEESNKYFGQKQVASIQILDLRISKSLWFSKDPFCGFSLSFGVQKNRFGLWIWFILRCSKESVCGFSLSYGVQKNRFVDLVYLTAFKKICFMNWVVKKSFN